MVMSRRIILKMRNFSDRYIEKMKTQTLCSLMFFSENHAVYEIIQKIMVEPDIPQMTERSRNDICRPDDKARIQTHSHNM
jgi:hypothetical protein